MSEDQFDNKSPEFISEIRICRFLLHPIIRSHVISSLAPWMFTNNATKAIADSLSRTVFEGNEVDRNHLVLFIKQNFKTVKLTKDDFRHILDIIADENKVRLDDIKIIVHTISEFIKSRLLAKGAEFYSRGNEEEAIKYFQDAGNFTLSESPFIDPSNEDLVMKLKELSFPGGKVIKSSIALYNDSSVYKGFKYGDLIMVCLTGETKVATPYGPKSLEELYMGDYKNFKILSYNELSKTTEIKEAKEVRLMKKVSEILEITLENEEIIKCTPEHKFLTKNRGWVEAKNLTEDDDLEYISKNKTAALKRWSNKEYREKISNSLLGDRNPMKKEENKKKIRQKLKGNKNALKQATRLT